MPTPEVDKRNADRRARDERIASEPQIPPLDLPHGTPTSPVEVHFGQQHRRPFAVVGIVENGLVRPLDPQIKLPEQSRVIIVASE